MEATNYHESARRVPAHILKEGKYIVMEDISIETGYGPMRSIGVKPLESQVVVSYIPRRAEVPPGTLVGKQMTKKNLGSKRLHPCHGITYTVEFE
jgi:hypothetical protein